ncbi:type II toxin-antitoxin system VapC family toxin [Mongoliimonas terrestris]|uniref:type II toxin-antitoxin system VapC family toxin n=1 Tax=Mongoliimonas terrestris TaxID=1709001 RepID=UPI0009495958|nr:type II toxin-antitoxin system VapC family toxin [Mongoliimonas terrestris]
MYLIDTNVLSEVRRGSRGNPGAVRWMLATDPELTVTSVVVLAELLHGVERLRRRDPTQHASLLSWYRSIRQGFGPRVYDVTEPIAVRWAEIMVPDRLPDLDALIAATALVHELTVVTRNVDDFERCGVKVFNPFI